MTVHPTPPADLDPLVEAHARLTEIQEMLETAAAFQDLEEEPPGLAAGYYQHGVTLAKALGMRLQEAAGAAQRRCEAAARQRGMDQCRGGCGRWLSRSELVRCDTGGTNEARRNHWHECLACQDLAGRDQEAAGASLGVGETDET